MGETEERNSLRQRQRHCRPLPLAGLITMLYVVRKMAIRRHAEASRRMVFKCAAMLKKNVDSGTLVQQGLAAFTMDYQPVVKTRRVSVLLMMRRKRASPYKEFAGKVHPHHFILRGFP